MTFRPFSSGAEFLDWENANCCGCAKSPCRLWNALGEGAFATGTIPQAIADRIGVVQEPYPHLGACREREAVQ